MHQRQKRVIILNSKVVIVSIALAIVSSSLTYFIANYRSGSEIKDIKAEIELKRKELSSQKENYEQQIEKLNNDIKILTENNKSGINQRISELNAENSTLKKKINELNSALAKAGGTTGENLKEVIMPRAKEVVTSIKSRDMKKLSGMVHPEKGIRFSPYAYVDVKKHRVLKAGQLEAAFKDQTKYTWGSFDGSGEPINMTFKEYMERFVYNKDYAAAEKIGYNELVSSGNTTNNAAEIYPNGVIVEYYIPGTNPKYPGMDWGSLRLVFESSGGEWYLVAVIHNEWTI